MVRTCWGVALMGGMLALVLAPAPATAQKGAKDVYTTVKGYAAVCKTFSKAMETAGVARLYQASKDPITLFAPTDDAFDKLKKEEVEALFKDKPKLIKLVTYHSIEGQTLKTEDLLKKGTFPNTLTKPFGFKKDDEGNVRVDGALITGADVVATNGMVHLIDTLLWPAAPAKEKDKDKEKAKEKDKEKAKE